MYMDTMRCHLIPMRIATINRKQRISVNCKHVEKLELLCTINGIVKWFSCCKKNEIFSKDKNGLNISTKSISRYIFKIMYSGVSKKCLHPHAHRRTLHSSQEVETMQVSINT